MISFFNSFVHIFNHIKRNKPPWINSKGNTNPQELIHTHLSLPVEHVPKPFPVYPDPACKFRNAHSSLFTNLVASFRYVLIVVIGYAHARAITELLIVSVLTRAPYALNWH